MEKSEEISRATKPAQKIVVTILGCGSSGGSPRVGNNWGDCDPEEKRNRRRRCSLLITGTNPGRAEKTNIIIDTGCDLREQLLDAQVTNLDAVFYTHEHADHTHGIDDLRAFALIQRQRLDVYFSQRAGKRIKNSFEYCFVAPAGGEYPPILTANEIEADSSITIAGAGGAITLLPILQNHGSITTFGFKIGNFLYSCDVSDFPEQSLAALTGLDVWILDALRPVPHPSHISLPQALVWIERMRPGTAVLTNLHIDMDYKNVAANTPKNVSPAYDGMMIDISSGRQRN